MPDRNVKNLLLFLISVFSFAFLFVSSSFAAAFGVLALLLTFSRSSYIALTSGTIVLIALKGYYRFLWIACLILAFSIAAIILLFSKQSEGTNLLRTASTAARFNNLFRAVDIIKDRPILGVGFDAYRYAQYKKGFITGAGWKSTHNGGGVNNSYLFVWATTGIVGLSSFVFLLKSILSSSLQEKGVGTLVFASLVALCVNSLFENSLFYSPLMLWLWGLVGLLSKREGYTIAA